jgi:predicted N-acetyltransferase YhbS
MATASNPVRETTLRPGTSADAPACGRICFEAFRAIAEHHRFALDFASIEEATGVVSLLLGHPGIYGVVAEREGRVIGSNFLDERSLIAGVGPITVDPEVQNAGVGRQLMLAVLERAGQGRFPGVRLLQAAYHTRSLSLYTKLGFNVREPVVALTGPPLRLAVPGHTVRVATEADLDAANRLCLRVHGHDRSGDLLDAIRQGVARVVERAGRITGYTSSIAFFGHTVGETNEDVQALIGAAPAFGGPGFLLPARNGEMYRWSLDHGLRVVYVLTLMTVGLYNEPAGAYLPSIFY